MPRSVETRILAPPKTEQFIPCCAIKGLINTFDVHMLKHINNISIWWHAVGTTAVVIEILNAAPTHQSRRFVFSTFIDGTGVDGVGWSVRASPAYVVVIGILMAQYTLTGQFLEKLLFLTLTIIYLIGFDASAHVCIELLNSCFCLVTLLRR